MRFRKLMFVLPNLFTVTSIFCGFYALTLCAGEATPFQLYQAALAIFFAMFFDAFDGRVARLTKTQSQFGVELDSLADVMSFGMVPSLLVYKWALAPLGFWGIFVSFAFCCCGALRLARFNVIAQRSSHGGSSRFFVGLPIPLAAGMIVSMVIANYGVGGGHVSRASALPIAVVVALFGASGVFGQLQDALNTIWGVKAKPGLGIMGYVKARFISFAMVGGVCFMLLVSLSVTVMIKGFSNTLNHLLPGGAAVSVIISILLNLIVITMLFAMIFKFLPDAKIAWSDVWIGAGITTVLFIAGKWALGLYLGSGNAGSAYGAAGALITTLVWVYYSGQIMLFGAEFTQVYANEFGSHIEPEDHAVRVVKKEVEIPTPNTGTAAAAK